jgi:hypothetical protein
MGNNRASRSKTSAGTYAEALKSMRLNASRNVEAAINASKEHPVPKAPRGMRKEAGVRESHALFDGVVSALAIAVCDAAIPGREVDMALLIGQALVAKVNKAMCMGEC